VQPFIAPAIPFARCHACAASLSLCGPRGEELSERQEFASRAIGEMIALGNGAAALATSENLVARVRDLRMASGMALKTLSKRLNIGSTVLPKWGYRECKPRFEVLVETCFRIGLTSVEFLQGKQPVVAEMKTDQPFRKRVCHPISRERLLELEVEINEIVKSTTAWVSAIDLAKKYGPSRGHMVYAAPEAYRRLTAHKAAVQRSLKASTRKWTARPFKTGRGKSIPSRQQHHKEITRNRALRTRSEPSLPITRAAAFEEITRLKERRSVEVSTSRAVT
jgi:hypothetical protein